MSDVAELERPAKRVRTTLWLSAEVREALDSLAADHDVSVSWTVRKLLSRQLRAIGFLLSEDEAAAALADAEAAAAEFLVSPAGQVLKRTGGS